MENLLQKIKEYTLNGSPSVGQIIELNDLAKKEGVKRNELEKLISQFVAEHKAKDVLFTRETPTPTSYDSSDYRSHIDPSRPEFQERVDTYERKEENKDFTSDTFGSSTFEIKEVNFDETNRNFENANKSNVKNTNYPDSKEREAEINSTKNEQNVSVEDKLKRVNGELFLVVNARKMQGLPPYSEKEFLEITNQIRQKHGLHKLKQVDKPDETIEKQEQDIEKPTIEPVSFDEHLDEELKVEPFDFTSKKDTSTLTYDQKIQKIKAEIQSINASNFYNGYTMTEGEYLALHNTLFESNGLNKIYRIEECIVPLPVVKQEAPKQEQKPQETNNQNNFTQSREEVARQLEILKKKEAEKQADLEKKVRLKKYSEELEVKRKSKEAVLNDLKSTRILAFVALGLSAFIIAVAGVVLGGITLIRLSELQKKINSAELSGNKETEQLFNTIRWVSIAAFVIGMYKMLRWVF